MIVVTGNLISAKLLCYRKNWNIE
jgi:hypothetical protein